MAGLYDLKCNTMQWWAFPGIRFKEPCSDRDFSPLAARNDRQTAPLTRRSQTIGRTMSWQLPQNFVKPAA